MKTYRSFAIAMSLIALLTANSCSKEKKAANHLKASEINFEKAVDYLDRGETEIARGLARKAFAHAEKTKGINPLYESRASDAWMDAHNLEDLFDNPESTVFLWLDAVNEGNRKLATTLFSPDHLARRLGESEEFAELLRQKSHELYGKEQKLVKSMGVAITSIEREGKEARTNCYLTRKSIDDNGQEVHSFIEGSYFTLDLDSTNGFWQITDLAINTGKGVTRVSDVLRLFALREGNSLTELLKENDLFTALQKAGMGGYFSQDKSLKNSYVSVVAPVILEKGLREVTMEQGRILYVLNQYETPKGNTITVITPDADQRNAANGDILAKKVEYAGTDESALWDISVD